MPPFLTHTHTETAPSPPLVHHLPRTQLRTDTHTHRVSDPPATACSFTHSVHILQSHWHSNTVDTIYELGQNKGGIFNSVNTKQTTLSCFSVIICVGRHSGLYKWPRLSETFPKQEEKRSPSVFSLSSNSWKVTIIKATVESCRYGVREFPGKEFSVMVNNLLQHLVYTAPLVSSTTPIWPQGLDCFSWHSMRQGPSCSMANAITDTINVLNAAVSSVSAGCEASVTMKKTVEWVLPLQSRLG